MDEHEEQAAQIHPQIKEMIDAMEKRTNTEYAKHVTACFSFRNIALIVGLNGGSQLRMLSQVSGAICGDFIEAFARATMKQDPHWPHYSETEKEAKVLAYATRIIGDVEMLFSKQKEFWK